MKITTKQLIALKNHYHINGWRIDDFNLWNIRNLNNLRGDVFNDLSGFFTATEGYVFQSTTDSGKKCIEQGGNGRGALFLKEGFHEDTLCLDIHNQRVGEGFCHRPGKRYIDGKYAGCKLQGIYRDSDRDFDIKDNPVTLYDGRGANVHPANEYRIVKNIGDYSWGCRVYLVWKEWGFAKDTFKKTDMFLKNPNVTLMSESLFELEQYNFIDEIYKNFNAWK